MWLRTRSSLLAGQPGAEAPRQRRRVPECVTGARRHPAQARAVPRDDGAGLAPRLAVSK